MDRVPTRIRVAVDRLNPARDDRVLEVGCGPGVAMALLCERLVDGHVTGVDRSATALVRALRRLRRWLDAGGSDLKHSDLLRFHGDGRPYDRVLAVDVNVFWTASAADEASRLRDLVADDGVVLLAFAPPGGGADGHPAGDRGAAALGHAGFRTRVDVVDGVVCVTGHPAG